MIWLHAFWHRKEPPERLEVWQVTGPSRDIRGAKVYHADFKASDEKNQEQCARLANEIVATAQHDCDTIQRKSWYEISIVDRHRSAQPVVRRLGPMFPKTQYLAKPGKGSAQDDPEDEESLLSVKPMILQYLDRLVTTVERKEQALNAITGDLLRHQSRENAELRAWNFRLTQGSMDMFHATQDALDRREDRADRREERQVARARDKLVADGIREAGRIASTLAPGVLRSILPAQLSQSLPQGDAPNPSAPAAASADTPPNYGPSEEREFVSKFLNNIKDVKLGDVKVDEKLLGDWLEEPSGKMRPNPDPEKAGVLTPEQVGLLIGVAQGWLPPDRVDELLPDGGHKNAITGEQLAQAQNLVPQSAMLAVFGLIGLRTNKRDVAQQAAATNPPPKGE
jgi:hypothetical protein